MNKKIQLLPGRKYLSGGILYAPGDFLPDTKETRELVRNKRAALVEDETEEDNDIPYLNQTVKDLDELAKARGIDIPKGTNKDGLVALLTEWDAKNEGAS